MHTRCTPHVCACVCVCSAHTQTGMRVFAGRAIQYSESASRAQLYTCARARARCLLCKPPGAAKRRVYIIFLLGNLLSDAVLLADLCVFFVMCRVVCAVCYIFGRIGKLFVIWWAAVEYIIDTVIWNGLDYGSEEYRASFTATKDGQLHVTVHWFIEICTNHSRSFWGFPSCVHTGEIVPNEKLDTMKRFRKKTTVKSEGRDPVYKDPRN